MPRILDTNEIFFTAYEPQVENRFIFEIDGIPAYLIKKASAPGFDAGEITLDHINIYRKLKGKVKWKDINIELYSPIVPSAAQAVMEWARLAHESVTGRDGYSDFYKKDLVFNILGPAGDIVSEWIIKGAFVKDADFGNFDWSSGEAAVMIKLVIALDYAVLNYQFRTTQTYQILISLIYLYLYNLYKRIFMLECKICNFKTDKQIRLSRHIWHIHKLKFPDYLMKVKYKGIKPICECGCGEETKYNKGIQDYCMFIFSHKSRMKGHWGNLQDPKKAEKISKTRKEKFKSNEYNHVREGTKNRDNIALGKSISKRMKGVAKPKPKGFGIGRKHSQETKDKMRDTQIKKWKSGNIGKKKYYTSALENKFQLILQLLNIKFSSRLYAKEIKAFYDFYIPDKNIVIEVDGDFWHCNPNSKYSEPKYESQKKNLIRDKIKEQWLKDNGYKLLRFWEYDINNNTTEIIKTLIENLK